MPDILYLLKSWWKQIFFTVFICLLAVGIITFLKPRLYLSVTTAVPASSYASDKSQIFSENIQALYSALGDPDDLDLVLGTAKLDTVYLAVTDQYNLFDHYKIKDTGMVARNRSASLLRKNSKVMKSEYGELKVKVWATDKNLAPQLANAITNELQRIHTNLKSAGNENTLAALTRQHAVLQQQLIDSSSALAQGELLQTRIQQYENMITQYQLMVASKPAALIVVEHAKPALSPDKPRLIRTLVATAVLSFLFALLTILVLERKKLSRQ